MVLLDQDSNPNFSSNYAQDTMQARIAAKVVVR